MIKKILTILISTAFIFGMGSHTSTVYCQESKDIRLMPMYGGVEKTKKQIEADNHFIKTITDKGLNRQEGSQQVVTVGWKYYNKGDWGTAMKRFNQAWLLDPENSGSYHGFAVIAASQNKARGKVEDLFQKAVSKSNAGPGPNVDYGRYLWTQSAFEKSLIQLHKTVENFPTAHDARSNISFVYYRTGDYEKACHWAQLAKTNNDTLEPGYLKTVCAAQ
jgi:Tfp pilus assembly protein PilF